MVTRCIKRASETTRTSQERKAWRRLSRYWSGTPFRCPSLKRNNEQSLFRQCGYQLLIKHGSVGRWEEPLRDPPTLRQEIMAAEDVGSGENGFDPLLARVIWSNDTDLLKLYIEKFGNDGLKQLFPGAGPGGWFVPKETNNGTASSLHGSQCMLTGSKA